MASSDSWLRGRPAIRRSAEIESGIFPLCLRHLVHHSGARQLTTHRGLRGKGKVMRDKLHGRSGLRVSELCLGAMTFGGDWGWGGNDSDSRDMFDAFADAGGNFIDTAYVYT